jgi:lipopolysaccharide export system permease protein
MLQNKIYQNFIIEIIRTFLTIMLSFSLIAWTVRAVNFLELIVDNGYPVVTYFQYSLLNLFGIAPKFILLSFLVSIIVFILKHKNDSEFIILWTSGVKKIHIVNLLILTSLMILIFYLILSVFIAPYALNKSRQLLNKDQLNSFLPTIRTQKFSDAFKGFTFIVEKKEKNVIENIFLHDTGNNIKNLSSDTSDTSSTTIISKKGIVENRNLFLIDGQIISSSKTGGEEEIIKFEQLSINLNSLSTSTIKQTKIQETSTLKLLSCFFYNFKNTKLCSPETKKEIIPILMRRLILPFYIPVIAIVCSFLLLKQRKFLLNKNSIFIYSFLLLLFTELIIKYTGLNYYFRFIYIVTPFFLLTFLYFFLFYKSARELR